MLIPVCGEKLSARLEVHVISARGLPVMNKGINSTDAFVEVRYNGEVEKTEVVTDLDPVWNSDMMAFDTDEREICENALEFRVMDHDTYSANDAIGRVEVDCNVLVESMRHNKEETAESHLVLPIWDTIYGLRGHLMIGIKVILIVPTDYTYYVQFFSSDYPPPNVYISEIVGLVSTIRVEKDPEQQWIDKIRSPRASNDARQSEMRSEMRAAAVEIAEKAHKAGAHMILGYKEAIDIEGSPTNNYCFRAYGTAVILRPEGDKGSLLFPRLAFPIVTLRRMPNDWVWGTGPAVSSRTVFILDDSENLDIIRKKAWTDLRHEIHQQSQAMGCNVVMGYTEEVTIHDGIAILTCFGTALEFGPLDGIDEENIDVFAQRKPHPEHPHLPCAPYHAAFDPACMPFPIKLYPCSSCKKELCGDLLMSTGECPPVSLLNGQRNYIQVSTAKKISCEDDDIDEVVTSLSAMLPSIDRELFNILVGEGRNVNAQGNAFFEIRATTCLAEGAIVCSLTAVLVRLSCLHKEDSVGPSLHPVLSLSSLQRQNDSRRFSWGTVREAMRIKSNHAPSATLKILHIKRSTLFTPEETQKKISKFNAFVGKLTKRSTDRVQDYLSHCVLERRFSASVGVIEAGIAHNSANVAGIHIGVPLMTQVLNREQSSCMTTIGRWRQIYIKEDNSGTVRDSVTTDSFLSSTLEELFALSRGALATSAAQAFTQFSIPTALFSASKDQAQLIILLSADLIR